MITAQLPWYDAIEEDECYAVYVEKREDFFPVLLFISTYASRILAQILAVDPANRITLPDLKSALEDVEIFFLQSEREFMTNEAKAKAKLSSAKAAFLHIRLR